MVSNVLTINISTVKADDNIRYLLWVSKWLIIIVRQSLYNMIGSIINRTLTLIILTQAKENNITKY